MNKIKKRIKILTAIVTLLFVYCCLSNCSLMGTVYADSVKNTDIVNCAKQYQGCSYVWGASGPNTFDCSGLVKYVFGKYGINLPHGTSYFWSNPTAYGKVVSESSALPGDLVCWSGHIGIYVGGGEVLSALVSPYNVCIIKVNSFNDGSTTNPSHFYLRVNGISYSGGNITPITPITPTTSRRIYADGITTTNAVLHWDLDDTPYMGTIGIWVAKSNETYSGKWVEFAPYSNTNKVSVDVNAECGKTLEPNTTYKYKFYYYVQNNCTWSDEGTFTTALGSSTPTTSRIIYVDNITETNALIHWDLSDTPYMGTVGIWIAKANETYSGKWVEFAPYSNTNKVSVDVNVECGRTLEKGTKYKYMFYYYVGNNCTWSNEGTFITKGDSTKPVITDAEVINLDSNGYTVRCRATDNVGIDRVQCPTWTASNDQDDIAKDWGTNTLVKATHIGNNVYEFKVKRSDHNNEYGYYHTHIYAYDYSGNQSEPISLNYNNIIMGNCVDIGDDLYTVIKMSTGNYCFGLYSSGNDTYFEAPKEMYDSYSYSSFVYRFINVGDNEYKFYHGNAELGVFIVVDDGSGKGYLIVKKGTNQVWKYNSSKQRIVMSGYVTGDNNQYCKFEGVEKRDRDYFISDVCYKYDGTPKSFPNIIDGIDYNTHYYKLKADSEWSNDMPTRTEVGTTKVYYRVESPCYNDVCGIASITVVEQDDCVIEIDEWEGGLTSVFSCKYARGFIVKPKVKNTTTFSSYTIVTSVIDNGKLYTDKKEYGPVVIEPDKGNQIVFVEPSKFGNAKGEYTTTITMTSVSGDRYERSIQYDFDFFKEIPIKKLKVGDSINLGGFSRLRSRNEDYNSGEIEIIKDENSDNFFVKGKSVGRIYLVGYDNYLRQTTMIVDVVDEETSENPGDNPSVNPNDNPSNNSETMNIKLQTEVKDNKISFRWNAPDKNAAYGIVYALDEQELDAAEQNNAYEVSGLKANGDAITYDCSTSIYKDQPGGVWFRVIMINGNEVSRSNAVKISDWGSNENTGTIVTDNPTPTDSTPSNPVTDNNTQNDNQTSNEKQDVGNNEKITLSALKVTTAKPSSEEVLFRWDSDKNSTGYIIEYSTNADLSSAQTGHWDSNYLGRYRLTGLAEKTTYYYRLRSYKGEDDTREYSEWTPVASVTTTAKPVTTEAPATKTKSVSAPKIKLKSVKNNKKKTILVKWKWNVNAEGYQISVAKKKSFSGAKTKKVGRHYESIKIKGLTKGKTYYVRIRSYVYNDYGSKVYSKWSSVKKVKIKK